MSSLISTLSRKQVRVLVADDDPVFRSLVTANLAPRAGSITEANDGRQAWDLLLNQTFELALIDLSMPNIDGYTLIQCMRAHPRTKHMPIIVITSSTDREAVERAFEVGATSFLTKPVNWGLFGHHIDYLVRLSASSDLARSTMHQAEAVARAKDAVIAMLAARIRENAARIADAARQELRPREADINALPAAKLATTALQEAVAIGEALDDSLPYLRGITEQIVVDDRPVSLERLLSSAMDEVSMLARGRDVRIEIAKPRGTATLRCDERAVVHAIGNVLRNAVQHSEPGGLVEIRTDLRDDNVLAIEVCDDGPGADPEYIANCLRPLDRLPKSAEEGHVCTGLGLPIAKGIAQAHGGMLEIATAPGRGTTAALIFPADIVEVRHEFAA